MRGAAVSADFGVSIDSRTIKPLQVFFAIKGPRHDGHEFLAEAVAKGAAGLVVRRDRAEEAMSLASDRVFIVAVDDTTLALKALAQAWVSVMAPKVVAVTGSVGKTTTKELTAAVLSAKYTTQATQGNLNNLYGVSLTCLTLEPRHEVLVVEMGTSAPGEIRDLCTIAPPDVAIVTAVAPAHLEGLSNLEGVAKAKAELVEALNDGGTAVLNADDEHVLKMRGLTKARSLTFGFSRGADVRIEGAEVSQDGRTHVVFEVFGHRYEANLKLVGRHYAQNAAAALAAGIALQVEPERAVKAMEGVGPGKHRMVLKSVGAIRLLDDCYNASPRSVSAALETLTRVAYSNGRKVVVLGDMLELGEASQEAHLEAGREASSRADVIVAVGRFAPIVVAGAMEGGALPSNLFEAPDVVAAIPMVLALLRPFDTVLVKGSRALGLERLVEAIEATFEGREEGN